MSTPWVPAMMLRSLLARLDEHADHTGDVWLRREIHDARRAANEYIDGPPASSASTGNPPNAGERSAQEREEQR